MVPYYHEQDRQTPEGAGRKLDHVSGSHHYWRKEGIGQLSIPDKRPHLKRVYVEQAVAFIDQEEANDGEE